MINGDYCFRIGCDGCCRDRPEQAALKIGGAFTFKGVRTNFSIRLQFCCTTCMTKFLGENPDCQSVLRVIKKTHNDWVAKQKPAGLGSEKSQVPKNATGKADARLTIQTIGPLAGSTNSHIGSQAVVVLRDVPIPVLIEFFNQFPSSQKILAYILEHLDQ